ncbi:MAG: hypothetical protein ACK55Z_12870, partial [bacterium]
RSSRWTSSADTPYIPPPRQPHLHRHRQASLGIWRGDTRHMRCLPDSGKKIWKVSLCTQNH